MRAERAAREAQRAAEDGKRAAAAMRVEEEEAKRAEAARKAEEEEALASERAGLFTPLASEDAWPLMPGGGACLLDGRGFRRGCRDGGHRVRAFPCVL